MAKQSKSKLPVEETLAIGEPEPPVVTFVEMSCQACGFTGRFRRRAPERCPCCGLKVAESAGKIEIREV
jgi:rubrerythrin